MISAMASQETKNSPKIVTQYGSLGYTNFPCLYISLRIEIKFDNYWLNFIDKVVNLIRRIINIWCVWRIITYTE